MKSFYQWLNLFPSDSPFKVFNDFIRKDSTFPKYTKSSDKVLSYAHSKQLGPSTMVVVEQSLLYYALYSLSAIDPSSYPTSEAYMKELKSQESL